MKTLPSTLPTSHFVLISSTSPFPTRPSCHLPFLPPYRSNFGDGYQFSFAIYIIIPHLPLILIELPRASFPLWSLSILELSVFLTVFYIPFSPLTWPKRNMCLYFMNRWTLDEKRKGTLVYIFPGLQCYTS